jgi:hypothetical protein
MSDQACNTIFHTIPVADLIPERNREWVSRRRAPVPVDDVVFGLPQESTSNIKFHRVPIRASLREGPHRFAPGSQSVVKTVAGLRRLLLKFPESYCFGIREYENPNATVDGERFNLSLGFALYDARVRDRMHLPPVPPPVVPHQNKAWC